MRAIEINTLFNLNANHIYYFHQGNWYHNLKRFPGILVDKHGYVKFETKEDYDTSPYLQHGLRLHIRNGISSIPQYIAFTEEQLFILNQINGNSEPAEINNALDTNNQAERKPRNIDSIVRNQTLVRKVKRIRDNTCQICNTKLMIGVNSFYSEVHHIRPLGNPHNGPDIISNMLCVCPNCHKKLDYGFVPIDRNLIVHIPQHTVDLIYIDYHNQRV